MLVGAARYTHNLTTEQHQWSDWGLSALLKDNFWLLKEGRALVIHFAPLSHKISSRNFAVLLTATLPNLSLLQKVSVHSWTRR